MIRCLEAGLCGLFSEQMQSSSNSPHPSRFRLPSAKGSSSPGHVSKKSSPAATPRRTSIFKITTTPVVKHSPIPNRLLAKGSASPTISSISKATCLTENNLASNPTVAALKSEPSSSRIGAVVYSPRKAKAKVKTYDRFISNRHAMDSNTAQFHIKQDAACGASSSSSEKLPTLDQEAIAYQEIMAKACGVALEKRILAFAVQPPASDRHDLRATWNRPMRPKTSVAKRRIPLAPEKILDAPGLADDYYLNLLDWSPKNILAVGLEDTVYIWNGDTGEVQEFCKTKSDDYVASLKWASDGSYLAVGTGQGDAQIWDVDSISKIRSMRGHTSRVGVLSWDQHILSSGARDGSIWNHDVRIAKHKIAELLGHTSEVCGLQWRPDGAMLASGGNDNLVQIWDARSSVPKMTKTSHMAAVKAIAWCPWQLNLLATGGGKQDHHIHFWNTSTQAKVSSINTGSQVTSIQWSITYKEFVSSHGFPNNHLSVWSYPSLNKIADLSGHDARILNTALSPDGETVASSAADENLKFWKVFERQKGTKDLKKAGNGSSLDLEDDLLKSYNKMTIR